MPGDREIVGVMPTERGTIQRGLASATQGQGTWPEAAAPSGRRLPTARRERKPALAAFALLLIIGGALAAGLLVVQSGKRATAIEIIQQVGAGQRIPLGAMQQVQVASGTGLDYVPWAEASQVTRYYAATTIPPGTLLTGAMVARASAVAAGREVLGLALSGGQLPAQLRAGDQVRVYAVSSQAGGSAALTGDAIVLSVLTPGNGSLAGSSGGTTDVTVAVSPADAGAVACDAAAGNVAVAVLPPAGAG